MQKILAVILFAACATLWPGPCDAAKIRYVFDGWEGPAMRVFVSRPAALAADRPVVFVMHGAKRNAGDYRDQWHGLALEGDFLVVVPEFSAAEFPGSNGYNLGYVEDAEGNPRPKSRWSYSAIEPIFDDVKRRFRLDADRYALYGHSAGAQFVHRFVFHVPDARVSRVVAANAGWYMMPDYRVRTPYGLGGSHVRPHMLAAAMELSLTVLLGDRDTDPDHPSLRRTPEALAQGPHRLARGERFYENARSWTGQQGVPFNWRLQTVPGVGHDNTLMAPAAAALLVPRP